MLGHIELIKCSEKVRGIKDEVVAMIKAHEVYPASHLLDNSLVQSLVTLVDIFEVVTSKVTLLFNGQANIDPKDKANN